MILILKRSDEELLRHQEKVTTGAKRNETLRTLFLAADQFISKRQTDNQFHNDYTCGLPVVCGLGQGRVHSAAGSAAGD